MPRNDTHFRTPVSTPIERIVGMAKYLPGVGLDSELLTTLAILVCRSEEHISIGLTVSIPGRAPETIAATDDAPVHADWLQHQMKQGPAVSPVRGQVMVCKDLGAADHWPDFGRMCVAVLGLRSMVNVEIPMPEFRASLNFYSAEPTAFDRFDVDAALGLARLAAPTDRLAVHAIRKAHGDVPRADASRVAIALATVMAQHRVGPSDGFALLREAARHSSRTLFDVAVDVVRNGGLPDETIAGTGHAQLDQPPAQSNRATERVLDVGGPDMWSTPPAVPEPEAVTPARRQRTTGSRRAEHRFKPRRPRRPVTGDPALPLAGPGAAPSGLRPKSLTSDTPPIPGCSTTG